VQVVAFGVYRVNSLNFDPDSGLQAFASGTSSSPSVSFSTSNEDDLVIAYLRNTQATDTITYPTGFVPITTGTIGGWEYLAFNVFLVSQSGTTVTWSITTDTWYASADALSG
jgi:hypothetical protein